MTSDDKAQIEEFASRENGWVRARILKENPPSEGTLLQIAERARDMAANSLGTRHAAYAVSLLNLGIYYDFIVHNSSRANELMQEARDILQESKTGRALYADALFQLGTARKERKLPTDDPKGSEDYLHESLSVQRQLSAEQLAANETQNSGPWIDRLDEACFYHTQDEDKAAANPTATGWEEQFASGLQVIADIVTRHRDYLREYQAIPWGCATPLQVCERLAAFRPTDAEWLRQLADAYDIIAGEQSGSDQIASARAATFFRERLIALGQQSA
jgi:hypothetical protein